MYVNTGGETHYSYFSYKLIVEPSNDKRSNSSLFCIKYVLVKFTIITGIFFQRHYEILQEFIFEYFGGVIIVVIEYF